MKKHQTPKTNQQQINCKPVGAGLDLPATRHNPKGITLIALIITIIVMLILVGVTVTVAIKGNLFETAKESVIKQKVAIIQESLQTEKVKVVEKNLDKVGKITIEDILIEAGQLNIVPTIIEENEEKKKVYYIENVDKILPEEKVNGSIEEGNCYIIYEDETVGYIRKKEDYWTSTKQNEEAKITNIEEAKIEQEIWETDEEGTTIIGYYGTTTEEDTLIIPTVLKGKKIEELGDGETSIIKGVNIKVNKLIIPEGIKVINKNCFGDPFGGDSHKISKANILEIGDNIKLEETCMGLQRGVTENIKIGDNVIFNGKLCFFYGGRSNQ